MKTKSQDLALVTALFSLAEGDRKADIRALALEVGAEPVAVWQALGRLEQKGLVDRRRVRLTFLGLALAAKARSRSVRAPALRAA